TGDAAAQDARRENEGDLCAGGAKADVADPADAERLIDDEAERRGGAACPAEVRVQALHDRSEVSIEVGLAEKGERRVRCGGGVRSMSEPVDDADQSSAVAIDTADDGVAVGDLSRQGQGPVGDLDHT